MRFLSSEWIEGLDAALKASAPVASIGDELALVVEQRVLGGTDGDVVFHLDLGSVPAAGVGPAGAPDVVMTQDWATAVEIARGTNSAQDAFLSGRLQLTGDVRAVRERAHLLGDLGDVFAELRASTDFD